MDLMAMLENHKEKGADISIATITVDAKEASDFGIMKVNKEGYISSFTEKPKQDVLGDWVSDTGSEMKAKGKIYLASMGIYIFTRKLMFHLLQNEFHEGAD